MRHETSRFVTLTLSALLISGYVFAEDLSETIRKKFDKVELAHLPTPLEEMKSLTAELGGPTLYIKRDDQTGLALGGNKTRKLEFIFADVLQKKADMVVTGGGVQSNWARQTAAAARFFGIKPVLVLSKSEHLQLSYDGNLLLDAILGADIRLLESNEDRMKVMERIAEEERANGHRPYVVSVGGSQVGGDMREPLGAIAYAKAFHEIHSQARSRNFKLTHVVSATGGGGTQAGLMVGAKAVDPTVKVVGILVSREKASSVRNIAEIANLSVKALDLETTFSLEDVILFDEYLGEGYGVLNQDVVNAIRLVARKEGILLDPVYTGKAMAGMIDLIKKGYFKKDDGVVFVHTGGTPALFVYKDQILERLKKE